MSEQNIVNVMVIPDVPKVLPGEQLYVYVPKASFTSPGIIAYNDTQFRIDGNFLFIREDYVSPGVQQKIDELKQYTDDELQLKQDKEDNNISLAQRPEQKSVVGAINDLGILTGQAQATADDAIRKIGDLSTLTTDEKTTLVGAINEVDEHANTAQQTADNATELANTGISKADQAQATADNATTLANTGISKADQAQTTANTAVDKANDAKATAQEAIMKADGRSTSIGFMTAKDAVTALNGYPRTQLKGGDTIWIVEDGTPDLWVTEVAQESVPYNYTTKDKFNQDLVDNKVLQIGYFKTAYQESDGKPVTIAWQNVLVKSTDWVASTEFADFPYEAKIELTDFVDYTTVPQVVFDIADTMSGNYAPICKSGDKCVYIYGKVQDEITLKTVITFAPNVNGASVVGGGYNNRGKWVASTTYEINDLVYTDNGQYVCIEGITSTTSPEQDTTHWQATFVATGKTKNTLTISGQDNGTEVQKTFDGSQAVEIAFDETTMTAKEVDGVLKVGAKGTIPEALPQTAGALKSGNLPTSGWNTPVVDGVWTEMTMPASREWKSVTYGDGKYVAIAHNSSAAAYSINGITWTETTLPVSSDWQSVTYGDGKYVAVEYNIAKGAYSTDGISWTEMSMPSYHWISVTYGNGKFVVVAENSNKGAYSTDGINWTETTLPASSRWQSVTYGDGKYVAVAYSSSVGAYSTDGITWVEMSMPEKNWRDVTYGDGKYVAVAYRSENGVYSTDGINWTEMTMPAKSRWRSVTYSDGKFVAIASDSANGAYSTDGITWIGTTMPASIDWRSVTYGGGKYVAVAFNSANGAYWKAAADVTYTISDTSITANSDVLMELTDDGGVKASSLTNGSIEVIRDTVPTSPIPYTYKVKQTNASGQFTLVNHLVPNVPVTSVNGQTGAVTIAVPIKTSELENDSGFITASDIPTIPTKTSQLTNDSNFATTEDIPTSLPVTYKRVSGELPTTGWSPLGWEQSTLPAARPWSCIAYGKGKFVTIAREGGKGAYSTDGIHWTETTMPSAELWNGIAYGNGKFVAVATSTDKGAYSVDGINWTLTTMPSSPGYKDWIGVAYGNGKFVTLTLESSYCAYSNDGITWTATTLPTKRNWRRIAYGNDKFVAIAKGTDKGAYSTDGVTWTEMTLPASRNWQGITYGEDKFIAIAGSSDKGAYSTDGITWTEMTLPESRNWYCTAYGNGKFVAIEYNGLRAAYSTDGITWLSINTPIIRSWSGVVYGDNKFVVVSVGASVSSQNNKGLYWEVNSNKSTYTISDTFITTNTSVKMYLTDESMVKALRMSIGSITVLRDSVPTTAIPYKYEVKQTSAPGGFDVINSYVSTVPTKTSQLTNDSGFAKTTEANTWTGVQTFSNADDIKTDRVHNLDNNDAWYNFDGSNNRFGSPSRPTIIRTSEARPRAQVPSGETTVTKEIALLEDIANALYPVGSIYMSVNNTNPSTLFGGTWEAWGAGKVPVGVDTNDTNFATVEKTGGEKQHTLTIAEMPAHNHTIPCTPTANDGSEPSYQAAQVNAEATGNHNSIVAVSSGGGSPHNNLQPYITCYMWKRTA